MSRIGKHPVEIPEGVEIKLEGNKVIAKGPLGTEEVVVAPELDVKVEDKVTLVGCDGDEMISVEEISVYGNSFNYEMICDVGKRVPRQYCTNDKVIK